MAQIARALARQLGLDEDLTETLALAHDLGHPPFGHAGERALDACLRSHGGFDHNAQTLRVVTSLEHRYPEFDGLNLTWESLEGIVKHNGPLTARDGHPVAGDSPCYASGAKLQFRRHANGFRTIFTRRRNREAFHARDRYSARNAARAAAASPWS